MVARAGGLFGRFGQGALQSAVGYGGGTAMGAGLIPIVQPITNEFWRERPTMPLPADVAAVVAIKRPALYQAMQAEARNLGFDDNAFSAFVDAADQPPGVSELLEMRRRNLIGDDLLERGLRSAQIEEDWLTLLPQLRHVLLSPADLAQLRQQGFLSEGEQKSLSALQGVSPENAEHLFEISGLPPGIELMIALWRRELIPWERVEQAVREGNTKVKYIPDLKHLRYMPLSPAVAAEAVLKQQLPREEGKRIAGLSGVSPDDFDILSRVNGRPMAIGQALDLVRRGKRGKDFFTEVVARSDVRTEYADDLLLLQERLLPLFQVLRLLRDGTLTDELATEQLTKQGYAPELVQAVIAGGHAAKASGTKDLGREQITEIYEGGFESRQWALDNLIGLGYDANESNLLLDLTEAKRIIAFLRAAINRVKASFVGHKIDESEALDALGQLGVVTEQSQNYMELWSEERDANVHRLTPAQIGKAFKLGLITREDAIQRWIGQGYPEDDAILLSAITVHPAGSEPSPTSTTA